MSLTDALLLEAHRDPRDVWISRRMDGSRGSGIDVTTLKVVGARDPKFLVSGIGGQFYLDRADHAQVSDFTVDCNMAGNPSMDYLEVSDLTLDCNTANQAASSIACGGLRLMGRQVTVRRVKVIQWGTKTTQQPCYAMALIAPDPSWPTALSSGSMEKVFGTGRVLIEGNLIELAVGQDGLLAIEIDDAQLAAQSPDYVHGDVIVRRNGIRYVDNQFDSGFAGNGILVNGARNLVVRENVVEVASADPIRNQRCGGWSSISTTAPPRAGCCRKWTRPRARRSRSWTPLLRTPWCWRSSRNPELRGM